MHVPGNIARRRLRLFGYDDGLVGYSLILAAKLESPVQRGSRLMPQGNRLLSAHQKAGRKIMRAIVITEPP